MKKSERERGLVVHDKGRSIGDPWTATAPRSSVWGGLGSSEDDHRYDAIGHTHRQMVAPPLELFMFLCPI